MLIIAGPSQRRQCASGFSLIELMISIVVGMLVVAGALKLVVAINQSNATTVQSARLPQEVRTTLEIIAADLRRARRVDDPIGMIGQVAIAQAQGSTFPVATDTISSPASGCLKYAYQGTENNAASTVDTTRKGNYFHAIYRDSTTNSVVLVADQTAANVTCTATPTATLISGQVEITDLSFAPTSPSTVLSDGAITVTIVGRPKFRPSNSDNYTTSRVLSQMVDVRSGKSGT